MTTSTCRSWQRTITLGTALASMAVCCAPAWLRAAEPAAASAAHAAEQGIRWHEMTSTQRSLLKPLEHEWPSIEAARKQKWLELSTRYPKMSPAEQARVQERMAEWARLTPQQRANARMHFQQIKEMPLAERQARWDAYNALSPEQKQEFAARAGRPTPPATSSASTHVHSASSAFPTFGPRLIGPTTVQARPGVTTTSITKRPTPPSHQHSGSRPMAATAESINKSTLLPQHGPQGPKAKATPASSAASVASVPAAASASVQ